MSKENAANDSDNNNKVNNEFLKDAADEKKSPWGYDLYPERRGEKFKPSLLKTMIGLEGKENMHRVSCETNVYKAYRKSKYY